jgi:hypothetical protein
MEQRLADQWGDLATGLLPSVYGLSITGNVETGPNSPPDSTISRRLSPLLNSC